MEVQFQRCSDFSSCQGFLSPVNDNALGFLHVNIRSIRKYWDQFLVTVNSVMSLFDVFVLTEINVKEDFCSEFQIPGYKSFFFTRLIGRGGGIAIFVKDLWCAEKIDLDFFHCESLSLRLWNSKWSVHLLAFYRPPSANALRFLEELRDTLEKFQSVDICLVGDFNIDTLQPTNSIVCDYLNLLAQFGLKEFILAPTREELLGDHLVASCLDHISIRATNVAAKSAVVEQKLADHYFVACQLASQLNVNINADTTRTVEIIDKVRFDKFVKTYNWDSLLSTEDFVEVYSTFRNQFGSFREQSRKIVTVRRRRNEQVWLTGDILSAIKSKDALWAKCRRSPANLQLKTEFRCVRNRVNALIRAAKRKYFRDKFFKVRSNISQTWSLINQLRGAGVRRHIDDSLEKVFDLKTTVAEDFNKFFATFSGVAPNDNTFSTNYLESNVSSAFLPQMTELDLKTWLFSFKTNKAPGIDGISAEELQRNYNSIKHVLLHMLNGFILTGIIPDDLKIALVKPLFKGGERKILDNYRPISILPCIVQILEKHILETMTAFLDRFSILSSTQYGFVSGRGTQPLLEDFADDLNLTFEKHQVACALFIDVAKAFDTVSHNILLTKLQTIGFRGPFLSLLQNFLTGRSQLVSIGNRRSSRVSLKAGVPQGSVLSPLLFNVFVNDMSKAVSTCKLFQYADDTVLLSRHLNYHAGITLLQDDTCHLHDWFKANCLTVNISKTKLVCFHTPLRVLKTDHPLYMHTSKCTSCNCCPVSYVDQVKYLGIQFESDLSWKTHLSLLCKKLRNVSFLLYNTRSLIPTSTKKIITHALAYSVLRYGITIFGHCPGIWGQKIDSVLKGIFKSIVYGSMSQTEEEMLTSLGLPFFNSLLVQTIVLKYFWSDNFKIPHVTCRSLRHVERFEVPFVETKYGKRVRNFYVPSLFNNLPDNVYAVDSLKRLKQALQCISNNF